MQGDEIGFCQQTVERDEGFARGRITGAFAGRIVAKDLHAECQTLADHPFAHVAHADDPEGFADQGQAMVFRHAQQGGGDIFRDAVGVTTGGEAPVDAALFEVGDIHVVGADGGGADKADPAVLQQGGIHPRGRSDGH